jgi:threonine/homoserine/homoserine lactone efflux protein
MFTATALIGFLCASMVLTIAPGPDNIFIITQGISNGRKPAVITALGMCSGVSIHTVAAALGLSAIFYSSAIAFQAVKFAGAAYLLYLAYKTIKNRSEGFAGGRAKLETYAALYRRGFLMNVLNPKVALFFLAFLPQFVNPASGKFALQVLILGLMFMAQAVVIFTIIGYFSGTIGDRLIKKPGLSRFLSWLTAGVFTALGVRLALISR